LTSETDTEDHRIIAIADDLFSQLSARADKPEHVKWVRPSGFEPSSVHDGLPEIRTNTVVLPNILQGKLQPDEWKPLLTSSIIYQYRINVRRQFRLAMIIWLSVLVLIPTVPLLIDFSNGVIPVLTIAFLFIFSVYYGIYAIPRLRIRARLRADRMAAKLVGREALMGTLERVAHLESSARRAGNSDFYVPTIERRLRNLR
jgi:hypothetical protein